MNARPETDAREVEVLWVTLWCACCDEEWDVLMAPEQASGDSDPDDELVSCPLCHQRGEWLAAGDDLDDGEGFFRIGVGS